MSKSRKLKEKYTDKKIRITRRVSLTLIVFMSIIVLYDSFVHELPFYYIIFYVTGLLIGHFVSYTETILVLEDENVMTLKVNKLGIIIKVLLLLLRFFGGKIILTAFSIVWVTDALYLLFIGIYSAKLSSLIRQTNKALFKFLYKSKKNQK